MPPRLENMISIVIPCYRSEDTIADVINQIKEVFKSTTQYDYEIVCVVDGSPDGVFAILEEIARNDRRVKVVSFAKNYGKHAALLAGYSYVSGSIVVSVDDDGECPVEEIWDLIKPLQNGYDVAMARYGRRPVSKIKELEHSVNSFMVSKMIGKPPEVEFSNFSARKRFVCDALVNYTGPFPYLEGETLSITDRIAMVDMSAHPRISGSSGFTFRRGLKLFINGCTTYSILPLKVTNYIGLACLLGSLFSICVGLASATSLLIALNLILFATVFFSLGMIGEYVGRAYMVSNHVPQFTVRETVNLESEEL